MAVEFKPAKVGFGRLDVTITDTKFGPKPFGWISPDVGYALDGTVIVGHTRVSPDDLKTIADKAEKIMKQADEKQSSSK